jgi:hypothetical protein
VLNVTHKSVQPQNRITWFLYFVPRHNITFRQLDLLPDAKGKWGGNYVVASFYRTVIFHRERDWSKLSAAYELNAVLK